MSATQCQWCGMVHNSGEREDCPTDLLSRIARLTRELSALRDILDGAHAECCRLTRERDDAREVLGDIFAELPVLPECEGKPLAEVVALVVRERDACREVLRDLSCDGCEYGDDCPPNGGTRHGECTACKCRRALGGG